MLLHDSSFVGYSIIENNNKPNRQGISGNCWILSILFIFIFSTGSFAQWVNNPSLNTRLVLDSVEPVNISSVKDSKGGFFLLWEDDRNNTAIGQSEVYFLHIDANGNASFRSDGKKITRLIGMKSNPVCSENLSSSAVVLWKDFSLNTSGDIYAQRITSSGGLLWTEDGIQISNTMPYGRHAKNELVDYSITCNKNGISFITYITKSVQASEEYSIWLQQVSPEGNLKYKNGGLAIYNSRNRKIMTTLMPDDYEGVFLFWLEKQNSKSVIFARHIDSSGTAVWGKKHLMISSASKNIVSYSVNKVGSSSLYIVWETQGKDKDIYHQLIDYNRKALWTGGGKTVTLQKGNQLNPQVLISDSTIILTWTNELKNDKNIFAQKYKLNGKSVWKDNGVPLASSWGFMPSAKKNMFDQKIISDGKEGAIICWIEQKKDSPSSDIFAQRINDKGKLVWDSSSVVIASYLNSEKSYLSMLTDERGGAIIIFKENREGNRSIYAQKVFSTGTYISQIMGFNTELMGDSVKIYWYSANEIAGTNYEIERFAQTDTGETGSSSLWAVIKTFNPGMPGNSTANYYEYYDKPDLSGTLYYRVVQKDDKGNLQPSDVSRIDYFYSVPGIVVGQNFPNPFNDSTVIKFYLPHSIRINIEFYNSRIEKIDGLDNLSFPAGENEITFFVHELPPGIYFYRFTAYNFVDVKKMIITN